MTNWRVEHNDVVEWAKSYDGPKFHAMLCDPPYHLVSPQSNSGTQPKDKNIFTRYGRIQTGKSGNKNAAGFMGKDWDGGDIAFRPETWEALKQHLYPGAFIAVFASSRGWHRLAVAIEDAGFIFHPSIFIFGYTFGSGFPKATRIDSQLQDDDFAKTWEPYRYGLQALKPAMEPIIIAQVPYDGRPVDSIVATGAGAINIDAGRIGVNPDDDMLRVRTSEETDSLVSMNHSSIVQNNPSCKGRWPANLLIQHSQGCYKVGTKRVKASIGIRGASTQIYGGGKGFTDFTGEEVGYADADGMETIDEWVCEEGCPILALNTQAGNHKSGGAVIGGEHADTGYNGHMTNRYDWNGYQDGDTNVSRFFFQSDWRLEHVDPIFYTAKADRRERDAGLEDFESKGGIRINAPRESEEDKFSARFNQHPTVKPLSLTKYLSSLLLPPSEYAPRRILIPFAGAGSEMIGAMLAGWNDITGIEMMDTDDEPYVRIANARLSWWQETMRRTGSTEVDEILKIFDQQEAMVAKHDADKDGFAGTLFELPERWAK